MSGGGYDYAFSHVRNFMCEMICRDLTPVRKTFAAHLVKVAAAMKAIEWADDGDITQAEAEKAIKDCLGL